MCGGTLYCYAQLLAPKSRIVAVEDGRRGPKTRKPLKRVIAKLKEQGHDAHWVRGNSHLPDTIAAARTILENRTVDFLHIDGDHSAAGSLADWHDYGPLVRPGGIAAFHDIYGRSPCHVDGTWVGVVRETRRAETICGGPFTIGTKRHKACGIGLAYI